MYTRCTVPVLILYRVCPRVWVCDGGKALSLWNVNVNVIKVH